MTTTTPETPDPIEQLEDHLADAAVLAETVRAERAGQAGVLAGVREQLTAETQRANAAETAFAVHMATEHPAPEPTKPKMILGGCPAKSQSGFSLKAAQGVVDRLGDGAGVRLYGGLPTTVAPRPKGAGHVHVSYDYGDKITRPTTVPELVKAGANLQRGDGWERQHESDSKVRDGKYTLEQAATALTDWAAKAKEARPDLLTTITFTGWLFSPSKSAPGLTARDAWGPTASHFDVTCVDLDGIHSWPYPNYLKHIPNILAFLDKFGIEWFSVGELGWSHTTKKSGSTASAITGDPAGAVRAEKYAELVDALAATGRCLWADAFLYDTTPGYDFTPGEITAWRALAAKHR